MIPVKDTRIQSSEFGDFHYRKFLKWAFANDRTKADFLRNVAVARVDQPDNERQIDSGLEHYSKLYNLSLDELDEVIGKADQNGVSLVELHNRLASGLRGELLWKRSERRRLPKKEEQ